MPSGSDLLGRCGKPRIVLFSGGTAMRGINVALCRRGVQITRVVPAWDNGGSSRILRDCFDMLPVGDVRHALMTMAYAEGRVGHVVKIFNARLSNASAPAELDEEIDFYVSGRHPLIAAMEPGLRGAILNYLHVFRSRIGRDFDLRRGSIGNFILTGATFAHNSDINTAIFVFRKLCGIEGNVWPASTCNDAHLMAELHNGKSVTGQDRITALAGEDAAAGIRHVRLGSMSGERGSDGPVAANPAVIEAVLNADAIVFGPGSFYTSILPHLLVEGVAEAISGRVEIPKILVCNMMECGETRGRSAGDLIATFAAKGRPPGAVDAEAGLLTHVLANRRPLPFLRSDAGASYLDLGDAQRIADARGIRLVTDDFEDPWQRGLHDADAVASHLLQLASPG
ncbi:gluconeogenesis factor YvcK family protein [Bradyrhizobium sp. HKCCYLS20291]|uniref:gluconeogenesis factor YvcK family protein n=1 Tax=Bradyrhizobium sp. HKCCYLS20291 TaxID=3420766 RepID=UPI003EBDF4D1